MLFSKKMYSVWLLPLFSYHPHIPAKDWHWPWIAGVHPCITLLYNLLHYQFALPFKSKSSSELEKIWLCLCPAPSTKEACIPAFIIPIVINENWSMQWERNSLVWTIVTLFKSKEWIRLWFGIQEFFTHC